MRGPDVLLALIEYVSREILEGKDVGLDGATPLLEWGIVNSLESVRLISFIQERFGVSVPAGMVLPEHFKDLDSLTRLTLSLAEGSREPC